MAASWNKGYDPKEIARRIEDVKSTDPQGQVTFKGFEHSEHTVILRTMINFGCDLPDVEKVRIINRSTFEAGKKGKITPEEILVAVDELTKEYHKRPLQEFHLITTLSLYRFSKISKQTWNGCTIQHYPDIQKKYIEGRRQILDSAKRNVPGGLPRDYLAVKAITFGKSNAEAANNCFDSIDLLRGIWNLFYNRSNWIRMSSGKRDPVNKILLGPIHSLHGPAGGLATESWWYQPEYQGPVSPHKLGKEQGDLFSFTNNVKKCLKYSCYRKDIESAILLYVRALDLQDWESAFLSLWRGLEKLTNTTAADNYTTTVRRASFMYSDREYHKQILNHLKDYRNRAVHVGSCSSDIEICMYQLKRYVEDAIEFHLGNSRRFESISIATEFMDLPDDIKTLERRIKAMKYAKKYLGHN